MLWSPQQDNALTAVARWIKSRDQPIYRLWGYAGTGKTTLARHLAEGVKGQVLFAAFTGKAALVMQQKGCRGASTIHSLIYKVEDVWSCPGHSQVSASHDAECEKCGQQLKRRPKFTLNRDSPLARASLLIIDESSMVSESLGRDLMSFNVPILVLGEPFQLPPPEGCGFFTDAEPDSMLTEIHRQARNDPIIAMSMMVREGGRLEIGHYGDSQVIDACDIKSPITADQNLVGLNATRKQVNSVRRKALGLTDPVPMVGDRLVCLRNNRGMGLLNGSLWFVKSVSRNANSIHMRIKPDDGGDCIEVMTHAAFFNGTAADQLRDYDAFDYGYALTVHKSQGSQWDSVLLVDESAYFRENRRCWLYTGITRAAKRIVVMV